jgi:hypothetical protein
MYFFIRKMDRFHRSEKARKCVYSLLARAHCLGVNVVLNHVDYFSYGHACKRTIALSSPPVQENTCRYHDFESKIVALLSKRFSIPRESNRHAHVHNFNLFVLGRTEKECTHARTSNLAVVFQGKDRSLWIFRWSSLDLLFSLPFLSALIIFLHPCRLSDVSIDRLLDCYLQHYCTMLVILTHASIDRLLPPAKCSARARDLSRITETLQRHKKPSTRVKRVEGWRENDRKLSQLGQRWGVATKVVTRDT